MGQESTARGAFGIDGATFDLMLPWAEQGLLPNLAGLLERGAYGPLQSTMPPMTPCAWTTMMTGTNPGRHGVFDFVLPRAGSYGRRMTTAADRKSPTVWMLASQAGLTVGRNQRPHHLPARRCQRLHDLGDDGRAGVPARGCPPPPASSLSFSRPLAASPWSR